ncbi:GNAT family N-acetyltransferase [Ideonella sp. B508-1]|uniref:GNAT family N-acetyltransferase n=1 Tax=Ideonella sp. B508-1 TaxID=137716 RepID=UPI000475DFF2|nr:GNAT family N-acetyltransferase [Ideonella sp. B508-1]
MSNYQITTDPARFDIEAVHAFLSHSYWSPGVPRAVVERAIQNSLCFGVLLGSAQVGFGRVITDRATFAYLADVYVLDEHRGKGLSKRLMDAVLGHPELQGLRRMLLATRDAHSLYAKYGFTPLAAPDRMMERHRPNVYQESAAELKR